MTENNNAFLSVVKPKQITLKRSKSTVIPPIEMLNLSAEKMDFHDAIDKYKVLFGCILLVVNRKGCLLYLIFYFDFSDNFSSPVFYFLYKVVDKSLT